MNIADLVLSEDEKYARWRRRSEASRKAYAEHREANLKATHAAMWARERGFKYEKKKPDKRVAKLKKKKIGDAQSIAEREKAKRSAKNKAKIAAYAAALLQRTPPWADLEAIAAFKVRAKAEKKHADHKIPLRGRRVSGLNVENNLQMLSPAENIRKGNRFDPETYVHELP